MAFLTEQDRKYRTPEDICAHLGDEYAKYMGAVVPPVFQSTLFVQPTGANGIEHNDYAYSRTANPTTDIAERKIAALEGGDGALCFATGMAAITSAILHFVRANCHVVLVATSYGGTMAFVRNYLAERFGVEHTLVDGASVEEIEAAIRPDTRLICIESPSSFIFRLQDLEAIAKIAKARGIGTVIDNTYATPLHQQPLKHGIDIVCHTASKYLGGHSDIMGGVIVSRREIIQSIQDNERSIMGGNMDPHQAWLLIRGLRTLPVRLRQHGENARRVVEFLEKHPKIEKVFYPGSATFGQPELFEKYLSGTNGLLSISPKGSPDDARNFIDRLHYFQSGCSWGGFESLAIFIGNSEVSEKYGQPANLVRLHVGLEDPETLIADIEQALEAIPD